MNQIKKYIIQFVSALILVLISTILFGQSSSVFDANYFNKDNSAPPIKIGRGFHIDDIYNQTQPCFTPESTDPKKLTSQQTGGKKTSIRLFYTKTNDEFNEFKTRGASGKVSFLNLFTLGGQKLEEYSNKSINNEERLIFVANVDFGFYSFDIKPKLLPEAKSLIDQKNTKEFVKYYGTHYISGVRKESSICVILTKTSSENSSDKNNSYNMQAIGDIPYKGSGSIEIDNGNWTNKVLNEYSYSVAVEINGPSITQSSIQGKINAILNGSQQDKASAIANIIESAVNSISNPNESIITQYYYSPFSLYGLDGIYWDENKQNNLITINEAVIKVYSAKSLLDEFDTEFGKEKLEQDLKEKKVPQADINKILNRYTIDILPTFSNLKEVSNKNLIELKTKYTNCSNIYCASDSNCCYLSDINKYNLDKTMETALKKYFSFLEEVYAPDCEKNKKGTITFNNLSSNPYDLYQGTKFVETIPGKSTKTYSVNIGSYNFKAVQNKGYLMYPTENKRTANITQACDEVILKIGFED